MSNSNDSATTSAQGILNLLIIVQSTTLPKHHTTTHLKLMRQISLTNPIGKNKQPMLGGGRCWWWKGKQQGDTKPQSKSITYLSSCNGVLESPKFPFHIVGNGQTILTQTMGKGQMIPCMVSEQILTNGRNSKLRQENVTQKFCW